MHSHGLSRISVLLTCGIVGIIIVALFYVGAQLRAQAVNTPVLDPPGTPVSHDGRALSGKNPIITALGRLLNSEEDIDEADRITGWNTLLQADKILTDVKEQNRQALKDLRGPFLHNESRPYRQDGQIEVYERPNHQ